MKYTILPPQELPKTLTASALSKNLCEHRKAFLARYSKSFEQEKSFPTAPLMDIFLEIDEADPLTFESSKKLARDMRDLTRNEWQITKCYNIISRGCGYIDWETLKSKNNGDTIKKLPPLELDSLLNYFVLNVGYTLKDVRCILEDLNNKNKLSYENICKLRLEMLKRNPEETIQEVYQMLAQAIGYSNWNALQMDLTTSKKEVVIPKTKILRLLPFN